MYKSAEEWTECFETSAIKLPQITYLGFSAETGELTDNHDIISVQAYNMHMRQNPDAGKGGKERKAKVESKPYNPGGEKEPGSWKWFLIKVVLLGVVVVGSYVGYTVYRTSRRGSRF